MPGSNRLTDAPQIKVNGAPAPKADHEALVDVRVSTVLGLPSELRLRFTDWDFALVDGSRYVIGTSIELSLPYETAMETVFEGEIVSVGLEQREGAMSAELTVIALDLSHRLAGATKVRTFQNMKYSDVVSKIAGDYGMRAEVEDTAVKHEYLIQTTTDYELLQDFAFRTGLEWRVRGKTLTFKKRQNTNVATLTYGHNIRSLRARFSATGEADEVQVRAWDPKAKQEIIARSRISAVRDKGVSNSTSGLANDGRAKAKTLGAGQLHTGSMVVASQGEADHLAAALAGRIATADLDVRCVCLGDAKIAAGATVKIEEAGTRLSGTYYVTAAEHTWGSDQGYLTTFSTGPNESSSFVDLLGGGPAARTNPFGQVGLTIGLVTNNKDPEGVGRVRVKFPTMSDTDESWWAPVVTPGASSSAGLMIIPQIGDEVLVGFEHGDLRRPYVLGGLWGGKAKPPNAPERFLEQNKVIDWGMKTANGSTFTVRSGSKPADKHFKFALPDGTTLYLGEDKTEIIAQSKSITLKSGQGSITITDKGDIEIKGMNIKINAIQNITVDGLEIAAKAKTNVKAEGSVGIELKGGASAKLEAGGMAEVKGAMVKIN